MSRTRNFRFTHNNYEDTELQDNLKCRYMVYGKEIAPTTGTPHLQGFCIFESALTLSAARKKLPGCDVRVADYPQEAADYCKKDGDVTERGKAPISKREQGEMEIDRYERAYEMAKEGNLEDIPKDILIRHHGALNKIKESNQQKPLPLTELSNVWYHGPPGSGKTRKAHADHPDAYLKGLTKWWNGYTDQEVVIIDDMDPCHRVLTQEMKEWCHHYPFPAEFKGGEKCIRPKSIIVTSNYSIDEIWEDAITRAAMHRRFTEVFIGERPLYPIFVPVTSN